MDASERSNDDRYPATSALELWIKSVAGLAADVEAGTNRLDRTVDDLAEILYLRNTVTAEVNSADEQRLEKADEMYMSATVADARGLGELSADLSARTSSWWWFRIPRSGAIRDEINEIRCRIDAPPQQKSVPMIDRDCVRNTLAKFGIVHSWVPRENLDPAEFILLLDPVEFATADVTSITAMLMSVLPHTKVWVIARTPEWDVEALAN